MRRVDRRRRTRAFDAGEPFAPGAVHEFKVDPDGNAIADIAYSVQFLSTNDGKQAATLRRSQGTRAAQVCNDGDVIVTYTSA
jgi:hypothetical protein